MLTNISESTNINYFQQEKHSRNLPELGSEIEVFDSVFPETFSFFSVSLSLIAGLLLEVSLFII